MTPSVIGTEVQGQLTIHKPELQNKNLSREDQNRLGKVNEIMSRYRNEMKQEMVDRSRISPNSTKLQKASLR